MRTRQSRIDDDLPVVLTPSALIERSRELANILGEIEETERAMDAKKTEFNARSETIAHKARMGEFRKTITSRLKFANRIAEAVRRQEDFRDQSTLKFADLNPVDEDPDEQVEEPEEIGS